MKRSKRIISTNFFRAWHCNQMFSAKISFGMLLCVKVSFFKVIYPFNKCMPFILLQGCAHVCYGAYALSECKLNMTYVD